VPNCAQCGRPLPSFSVGALTEHSKEYRQRASDRPPEQTSRTAVKAARPYPRVTVALIAINVAVFLAMTLSGVSPISPSSADLLKWGADWGPQTLGTQPWRALTSNYVHIGLLHILLNMWCLWNLGFLAERLFGRFAFLLVYTVTGIAGSIASLWWSPTVVSAGASGAIFGIAGALITALYLGKLPVSREALKPTLKSVVSFAVYNLFIGAASGFVNNAAHIGGLLLGLALGAILGRVLMEDPDRRRTAETLLFAAATLVLLAGGWLVRQSRGEVVALWKAGTALENRSPDEAIRLLEPARKTHPDDAQTLVLLGRAYIEKKDYAKAEDLLNRALIQRPGDLEARYYLGLVYLATQRWEPAHDVFSAVTQKIPKDDDSWILLGNSLDGLGKGPEAIAAYQRAIELNPKNADAYRELGLAQLKLRQTDAAIQSLRKATELAPKSLRAQRGLGAAYRAAGRPEEADAALRKADEMKASGASDEE